MTAPRESDDELLAAWQAGDRSAGDRLFVRHFDSVDRVFQNKVDADHIRDLVQRTFMACFERPDSFRRAASFRAYLLGTAYNVLREYYRAKRRLDHDDVDQHSVLDLGAGPSSLVGAREEQRLLLAALRSVSIEDQTILELYFWEDLTGPEIASILGVNEDTARSRLRRARIRVGEALARLATSQALSESTFENLDAWARSVRSALPNR